jgi:hypothetical protein
MMMLNRSVRKRWVNCCHLGEIGGVSARQINTQMEYVACELLGDPELWYKNLV